MLNFTAHAPPPSKCNSSYCAMNQSSLPDNAVFPKPLLKGGAAAVLYNNGRANATFGFDFAELVSPPSRGGKAALGGKGSCGVKDVWAAAELGVSSGRFEAEVVSHSVVFVILHDCK